MKYLLIILMFVGCIASAQESKSFTVSGKVKQQFVFNLDSLKKYQSVNVDSITIYNHLMLRKSSIKNIKGVLLKDVLSKVEIISESPKKLSEYYIVCTAIDGYKVVFSWNEIFNTKNGNNIMVLTDFYPDPIKTENGNIAIIAPNDIATGRRFLKGLDKIAILQVN